MNIKENTLYHQAIVGMVLAATAPNKKKLKECVDLANHSKNSLLYEIEQFLMDEADKLLNGDKKTFDEYFKKHIKNKLLRLEQLKEENS